MGSLHSAASDLPVLADFAILTIAALVSAWLAAQWLAGTMKDQDDDN